MQGWLNFHLLFSAIMAVVMLWMLFRRDNNRLGRLASSLILAGIFGNVTDRLLHGHVIDFLDFYLGSYHWPAFNVADSAIVISVGLFLWESFRGRQPGQG